MKWWVRRGRTEVLSAVFVKLGNKHENITDSGSAALLLNLRPVRDLSFFKPAGGVINDVGEVLGVIQTI